LELVSILKVLLLFRKLGPHAVVLDFRAELLMSLMLGQAVADGEDASRVGPPVLLHEAIHKLGREKTALWQLFEVECWCFGRRGRFCLRLVKVWPTDLIDRMRKLAVVAAGALQVSHVIMTELSLEADVLTSLVGVEHRVAVLVNEHLFLSLCLLCFFVRVA
jgi:hypothetical protein